MSSRSAVRSDTLAVVLAGGQGERLHPLTRHRGKPAVPFGGIYRIVDFTLSNCLNSGLRKIYVLTQYKSGSLERHVQLGWDSIFSTELDEWIFTVPPQLRVGQRWYEGTADAVYQNIYLLERERPKYVVVLSGDHIYKMDYGRLVEFHVERGASATVAAIEVPSAEASGFGVIDVEADGKVSRFVEKPPEPPEIPGKPGRSLANMGVYVFETASLVDGLMEDANADVTRHDFGHDILPSFAERGSLYAWSFEDPTGRDRPYWRDVGTIDAYYDASMDLVSVEPVFNLYDPTWPLRTYPRQLPPAKTVLDESDGRRGLAVNSLMSGGSIISGGQAEHSILSPYVRLRSYGKVQESVLLDGVDVGRHARVRRAIIDKNVQIPEGAVIGEDPVEDARRFRVSPSGIAVVTAEMPID